MKMQQWSGSRLLIAIVSVALLSMAFNFTESDGLPTKEEYPSIILGFGFLLIIYSFFVTVIYSIAVGMSALGLPGWPVFAGLFFVICATWSWFALSGYDTLEIGGNSLIVGHKLTHAGWNYWERGTVESAPMAVSATLILFGRKDRS
ncbi:MAG TPA: hypothetical protein VIM02_02235 [Rhizomicrobium sp.]